MGFVFGYNDGLFFNHVLTEPKNSMVFFIRGEFAKPSQKNLFFDGLGVNGCCINDTACLVQDRRQVKTLAWIVCGFLAVFLNLLGGVL